MLDGVALVITSVIGAGILTTPGFVSLAAPGPLENLLVWCAGAGLALVGALIYAELATRYPTDGGEFIYIRAAFGPMAAFLSGWTSFVAGFSGALAAAAVACADHIFRAADLVWNPSAAVDRPELRQALALALVWGCALVQAGPRGGARWTHRALASLNVATLAAILIVGGLALTERQVPPGDWSAVESPGLAHALVGGLLPVTFAFSGWNAATYLAGQFRDPKQTIPAALVLGLALVTIAFLGMNHLVRACIGPEAVGSDPFVGVGARLLGPAGAACLAGTVALALAASVNAMTMTGPRVYLAMARTGVLPAAFARIQTPDGPPKVGIWAQAAWSSVLLAAGSFEALVRYTAFSVVLFSSLAAASLFVARRKAPPHVRVFKVPFYPWLPMAFVAANLTLLGGALQHSPMSSVWGAGVIAAGIPIYFCTKRRNEDA